RDGCVLDHDVALLYFPQHLVAEIRKGGALHHDDSLDAIHSGWHARRGVVIDEIIRHDFVQDFYTTLAERLGEDPAQLLFRVHYPALSGCRRHAAAGLSRRFPASGPVPWRS